MTIWNYCQERPWSQFSLHPAAPGNRRRCFSQKWIAKKKRKKGLVGPVLYKTYKGVYENAGWIWDGAKIVHSLNPMGSYRGSKGSGRPPGMTHKWQPLQKATASISCLTSHLSQGQIRALKQGKGWELMFNIIEEKETNHPLQTVSGFSGQLLWGRFLHTQATRLCQLQTTTKTNKWKRQQAKKAFSVTALCLLPPVETDKYYAIIWMAKFFATGDICMYIWILWILFISIEMLLCNILSRLFTDNWGKSCLKAFY